MPDTKTDKACPNLSRYQQLASGMMSDVEKESLLSHLENCDACAQKLKDLPEPDTLVGMLRQADTVDEETTKKVIAGLVERLSKLRPEQAATGTKPRATAIGAAKSENTIDQPPADVAKKAAYEFLAQPEAPDELGRLGPYRILSVLGTGGMGVVFRAEDPQLARLVALKAMLPGSMTSENARPRFLREAQAAAAIKHDHIVTIHQVGEDRGVLYLAMELLDGEPLDSRLQREGKLPVAEVLRIGRQIAHGLAAAHKRGLIHRDIKPANIWLESENNRVKILDFGLARTTGDQAQLTQQGAIVGTPAYMAPEQGKGKAVDHRCDLFSLGCVLYRMATGAAPFSGTDVVSTLLSVATETPKSPRMLEPQLPRALSDLIVNLLAKSPADRPASAQVVVEKLDDVAQALARLTEPAKPRKRWPMLAAAAAILALLAAGIVFYMQTPDGVVRIEIDDPEIKLSVQGHSAIITKADKQPIILKPGKHGLTITRGDFTFNTASFELDRRGKTALKITWHPGQKMVVMQDGIQIAEKLVPPVGVASGLLLPRYKNSCGMEFALVPKGKAWLGGGGGKLGDDRIHSSPFKEVDIVDDFYLGVYEVTQEEWEKVTGLNPSRLKWSSKLEKELGISKEDFKKLPVESVSWDDAELFIDELNKRANETGWIYRLPTETEWEYACRGGPLDNKFDSAFDFYFDKPSNKLLPGQANFRHEKGLGRPCKVGSYQPNRLGLYDMHGNVYEWCTQKADDGTWLHVTRGGGFGNHPEDCRAGRWNGPGIGAKAGYRNEQFGLRVARVRADAKRYKNSLGMEFALVPKGKSWLGGGGGKPGDKEVEFKDDFYLGIYEVTQKEWRTIMGNNPSAFHAEQFPVEGITRDDAQSFLELLNAREKEVGWVYRLPTEAEWEYACRGGPLANKALSAFDYYLDRPTNVLLPDQANMSSNRPSKVGTYKPNRLGLYDMHGNVAEWCDDVEKAPNGTLRGVLRSSTWDYGAISSRATMRNPLAASDRRLGHGLRVARVRVNPDRYRNSLGMEFALVPKGKAWLGGGGGKPGDKEVEFKDDFYLGVYEVTQEEWHKVTGNNPSAFKSVAGISKEDQARFPVENISWDDAQDFIKRFNEKVNDPGWQYRLPTQAEWEYACRGGNMQDRAESAFDYYLETPTNVLLPNAANFQDSDLKRPCKVGMYRPNRLGLHDMHGNVWEWCDDLFDPKEKPKRDSRRVIRGGCWDNDSGFSQAAYRLAYKPSDRWVAVGLRVARVRVDANRYKNSLGMEFALVPKGKAWLGGGGGKPGDKEVEFKEDFYLGVYEVTQEEWQKVTGLNPSRFSREGLAHASVKDISDDELRRFPVDQVSWDDAQAFLKRLNARLKEDGWEYRLPKEAEWEYACRGGPLSDRFDSAYDFYLEKPTNQLKTSQANFDSVLKRPCKVGSYKPNALGLHDMHGNVWEWCDDAEKTADGSLNRVRRGGGYVYHSGDCRAANRTNDPPSRRTLEGGLRLARVRIDPNRYKNSLGMEFALVPKGKSWLGGGGGKPGHKEVELKEDFYLGIYEVTQDEWELLMGTNPSAFKAVPGVSKEEQKRFPVEMVTWEETQGFIKRLNESTKEAGWVYRLPTEVEWEYACRGGPMANQSDSAFDFYFENPTNQLLPEQANFNHVLGRTCKVGTYKPNRLGLYDMHGNVWERCDDEIPQPDGDTYRVHRGGGLRSYSGDCRTLYRYALPPSERVNSLGLRVARVRVDSNRYRNSLGMEFALVPKGKSWVGGGNGKVGDTEFELKEDFYLGVYEVTQEEWEKVMGNNPSAFKAVLGVAKEDQKRFPVEMVSWEDAQLFLKELNSQAKETGWVYRLPKEAEWEYACRGGPTNDKSASAFDFYFEKPTNQLLAEQANFQQGNGPKRTCKVGSYQPNRLGLYDMHGNVWEWCEDLFDPKDPARASLRVIRGGCWVNDYSYSRAAYRHADPPSARLSSVGLRVARVPVGGPTPGDDPDRTAANYALSIGGTVRVNGEGRDIKAVAELPGERFQLTWVALGDNNRVSDLGLANFKDCKSLLHLTLHYDRQVGDAGLAHLTNCKDLTFLALHGTQVSDDGLVHLKEWKNLTYLHLEGTKVSDAGLVHLKECKKLTQLHLCGTKVGDTGIAHLKECKNLTHLDLSGTNIRAMGLADLDFKKLEDLSLCDMQLSDAVLTHFKDYKYLTHLRLDGSPVSDVGLAHLKGCTNLKELLLRRTKVSAMGIEELNKALPRCGIVWDKPAAATAPPSAALEALRRDQIPPEALRMAGDGDPNKAPASLVAVLGEAHPIHSQEVLGLAYSPDGRWLASGSVDRTVMLRDTAIGQVKRVLKGHTGPVSAVGFSKDGRTLVSAGHDGTLRLWSVDKEQKPAVVEAKLGQPVIHAMAVSPDGRFVAAAGDTGLIKLWKWGAWEKPIELPGLTGKVRIRALGFSPDGALLACGGGVVGKEKAALVNIYATADGSRAKSRHVSIRSELQGAATPHDGCGFKLIPAVGPRCAHGDENKVISGKISRGLDSVRLIEEASADWLAIALGYFG